MFTAPGNYSPIIFLFWGYKNSTKAILDLHSSVRPVSTQWSLAVSVSTQMVDKLINASGRRINKHSRICGSHNFNEFIVSVIF